MSIQELIANNPYRQLGVNVGAPLSQETRNLSRIRAFARVEQTAELPLESDDFLPALQRTEDSANEAAGILALPVDRIRYALFWFSDGKTEWGAVLNNAVRALYEEDYLTALTNYARLFSFDALKEEFLAAVTHGLKNIDGETLLEMLAERIIDDEDEESQNSPVWRWAKQLTRLYLSPFSSSVGGVREDGTPIFSNRDKIQPDKDIAEFEQSAIAMRIICESLGLIFGINSPEYQNFATEVAEKLYTKAAMIITEIGNLIWVHKDNGDKPPKATRKAKLSMRCVRICLGYMDNIEGITAHAIDNFRLDETSNFALSECRFRFNETLGQEYEGNYDRLRKIARSYYCRTGAKILSFIGIIAILLILTHI
ncbi:MAG: hypothetical protein J6C59_01560 [Muribaculaceae bacterium]|nr:hypothetical protein [Muribaculaceae bacterium]